MVILTVVVLVIIVINF